MSSWLHRLVPLNGSADSNRGTGGKRRAVPIAPGTVVAEPGLVSEAVAEVHASGLVPFGVNDRTRRLGDVRGTVEREKQHAVASEHEAIPSLAVVPNSRRGERVRFLRVKALRACGERSPAEHCRARHRKPHELIDRHHGRQRECEGGGRPARDQGLLRGVPGDWPRTARGLTDLFGVPRSTVYGHLNRERTVPRQAKKTTVATS